MALTNARAGGGSSELFLELIGAIVIMRVVSHDGTRTGQNDKPYDVVTVHLCVLEGPGAGDSHANLIVTGAGITGVLTSVAVGDDVVAQISSKNSFGRDYATANPVSDAKFAQLAETLEEHGSPFDAAVTTPAPVPAAAAKSKPPWAV